MCDYLLEIKWKIHPIILSEAVEIKTNRALTEQKSWLADGNAEGKGERRATCDLERWRRGESAGRRAEASANFCGGFGLAGCWRYWCVMGRKEGGSGKREVAGRKDGGGPSGVRRWRELGGGVTKFLKRRDSENTKCKENVGWMWSVYEETGTDDIHSFSETGSSKRNRYGVDEKRMFVSLFEAF